MLSRAVLISIDEKCLTPKPVSFPPSMKSPSCGNSATKSWKATSWQVLCLIFIPHQCLQCQRKSHAADCQCSFVNMWPWKGIQHLNYVPGICHSVSYVIILELSVSWILWGKGLWIITNIYWAFTMLSSTVIPKAGLRSLQPVQSTQDLTQH